MARGQTDGGDSLSRATDAAIGGDTRALYDILTRGSQLPGPRANDALADVFADGCRSRGALADKLIFRMATLDAESAPGASALEFLPLCGVLAAGARAAVDERAYPKMLDLMHASADDFRFRVRDAVVRGLARIGAARGDALVPDLAPWMDGFFHAAAVLTALGDHGWQSQLHDPGPIIARLDEAFALARDATRASFRYPGHKALLIALGTAPAICAARFGVPIFDMLVAWSAVKEPVLREAITKGIAGGRLAARFAPEVQRVERALAESAPGRRDPRTYVGPTRGRGKSRRR